ncbi:MAG: TetR/AcrR family transcriptional regulator [Candidatus Neomarinimicrobiota bacterium]
MRSENVTKDKILMTAAKLFADKGFDATSMREIAESCEVTKPALYYYFPDKKALFAEIIKTVINYSYQLLSTIEKSDIDPIAKLNTIATKQFLGIKQHPEVTKFLINVAMRNLPAGINISFFDVMKKNEDVLIKIVKDAKDMAYFRADMDVQTFLSCFIGGLNNYVMRYFKQGVDELTEENAKKVIDTLVEGVRNRNKKE